MEYSIIVFKQIIVMFLLMTIGYILYKKKWLDATGSSQISTVLVKIVTPALIIQGFHRSFIMSEAIDWGIVFVSSFVFILLGMYVSRFVFKKDQGIEKCAISLSNVGFIGIPLVQAMLGNEYVFYLSAYLVGYNILTWTFGIVLMTNESKYLSLKKILLNPASIALWIGIFIYIVPLPELPEVIVSALSSVASLNTPLAMLVLGSYIASEPFKEIFHTKNAYLISFLRLFILPISGVAILSFFPFAVGIKYVILLASATPSAVMIAMFAQMYQKDYQYAARIVSITSLLCMVSIPIVIMLANLVW